jgi:hypothetical protein
MKKYRLPTLVGGSNGLWAPWRKTAQPCRSNTAARRWHVGWSCRPGISGLPQAPCLEVLARVTAHAAQFDALAREHPVREDTRRTISRAIADNVARVAPVVGG